MITSYHFSSQQICFTLSLEPVTSRFCGLVVVSFCVGCFLLFLLFGSLCFGSFSLERDKGTGLCIGPLPVDFCGPTAWPLRELIN